MIYTIIHAFKMIFKLLVFLSFNSYINQVEEVLLHVSLLFGLYGIGLHIVSINRH